MQNDLQDEIAAGRTARIYRVGDGSRVAKRYDIALSESAIQRELTAMAVARQRGLPVPEPGAPIERGFTMGFVAGQTGMQRLLSGADTEAEARATARLHARLNACDGAGLTDYRSLVATAIREAAPLTASETSSVLARLDALPHGDALLHGDLHPGNIVYAADGPVVVDWVNAGYGPPIADVARSLVLFGWEMPGPDVYRLFQETYLAEYAAVTGIDLTLLEDWLLVQRAARLREHAEGQPELVLAAVRAGLAA